jgi:tRNA/tmRNA/rRNA uracil-C5-methylase (TrmA/RlmC/RlmD family)
MKKNDIVTIEITDINNLGHGVGRHDGVVIFVAGGVSGDMHVW